MERLQQKEFVQEKMRSALGRGLSKFEQDCMDDAFCLEPFPMLDQTEFFNLYGLTQLSPEEWYTQVLQILDNPQMKEDLKNNYVICLRTAIYLILSNIQRVTEQVVQLPK